MRAAERAAIREAARRVAAEAPELSRRQADVLSLLLFGPAVSDQRRRRQRAPYHLRAKVGAAR